MNVQVQIPSGVGPQGVFHIDVNGQLFAVNCPPGSSPGSTITIQVPAQPIVATVVSPNQTPAAAPTAPMAQPYLPSPYPPTSHSYSLPTALPSTQPQNIPDPHVGRQIFQNAFASEQTFKAVPSTSTANEIIPIAEYGGTAQTVRGTEGKSMPLHNLPGLSLPAPPHEVQDWTKGSQLGYNQTYYLDGSVKSVKFGLAWDTGCDVDGNVALFDDKYNCVDIVSYGQLTSRFYKAVEHSGDDRTGWGGGDDEIIKIRLRRLPPNVYYVMCIACIYSKTRSFKDVRELKVRLYHGSKKQKKQGKLLCQYDVSKAHLTGRSMLVACLIRNGPWWSLRALGKPFGNYSRARDLIKHNGRPLAELLAQFPGHSPETKTITISVLEGRDLVPKDKNGKSDPFIRIKYRKTETKCRKVKKTLNPKWHDPATLTLKGIDAAEAKKVKIKVYDYDRFSFSDFMGLVKIPAAALYNLGQGRHKLWLPLSPDLKHHPDTRVSGEVLVEVTVY